MYRAAVGTIVAKNFVPFARVLARSFREQHPAVQFFVALADRVEPPFVPAAEPFETVPLEELRIPDLRRLSFRYSRQQLSIAVKPYFLRYLLHRGFTAALFLDADILVLDSLHPLFAATAGHAVALTPHLISPASGADRLARELNILQSGIYNGGFVGVSQHESASRFLDWWADRLHTHCRHDVPQGMHYDQRWLDLVPAIFDDVHVVRDAGCNIAYWNLPERDVAMTPIGMRAGGERGRFFHFSGFEPERPLTVTRYARRVTMESIGPAAALFAQYVDLLRADGYFECRDWPYAFGSFDNGVPIPEVARRLHLEMGDCGDRFGDPFRAAGSLSYFQWLNEPAEGPAGAPGTVTRLWEAVYRSRPDLQQLFPDVFAADHRAFLEWIAVYGLGEHHVDAAFAP